MLELTCDNVLDYLHRSGWLEAGPARAELLAGGVSNQVLRIVAPDGMFVVKQSRPQLETRDAWFSDLSRIWREYEVMDVLSALLPAGTVPTILFVDRQNYLYAMSHAPREARVWKEILLSAEPFTEGSRPAMSGLAGQVLGIMHQQTATRPDWMEPFRDHAVFVQLRVDPFYRRIQERRPEVAHVVADIIDEMLSRKEALCHGDYTPKNMLVHAAGFTLVDYETAHLGDPTMDLGLFLTHILLKAVRAERQRDAFFAATRAFWESYAGQVSFQPAAALQTRGIRHLGVCLLARIDGTSPVDYLTEPQRDAVRRWGRRILLDRVCLWEDVLACWE